MQVVVGLGNPGPRYERTRHNLGFRVVQELARRHSLRFGPAADDCVAAAGRLAGREATLVLPLSYMNRSGEALAAWARTRGLDLAADGRPDARPPLAVCDDIALPLGALRLRAAGSDGGHRGLASLVAALGGTGFPRLRLGVARDRETVSADAWADFVLGEFDGQEWERSETVVADACEAVLDWLRVGTEIAGSRHNRRGFPG